MYLLQERLGEAAVNRALARFVAKFRFKGAPYLRSIDLIAEFRKEARTPEQQQLITDLFERITLYDLKVTNAETSKEGDGWTTTLTLSPANITPAAKASRTPGPTRRADRSRAIHGAPGHRGVLDQGRDRHGPPNCYATGPSSDQLHSKRKPDFAGVDPYNFYVDRNSDDNVRVVDAS